MSLVELLILLIIAGICGSIAQVLVGFSRGGCLISIVIGFIGAYLGSYIARKFELPPMFMLEIGGTVFPVIWSILGGLVFAGILSLLFPRRNY